MFTFRHGIEVGQEIVIRQSQVGGGKVAVQPYRIEKVAGVTNSSIITESNQVYSVRDGERMARNGVGGGDHIAIDHWEAMGPDGATTDHYGLLPVEEAERRNENGRAELRAWARRKQIQDALGNGAGLRYQFTPKQMEAAAQALGLPDIAC